MAQTLLPKIEDKLIPLIERGATPRELKRLAYLHLALRPYDMFVITHRGKIDEIENSARGIAQIIIFSTTFSLTVALATTGVFMSFLGMAASFPALFAIGNAACLLALFYTYPTVFRRKT